MASEASECLEQFEVAELISAGSSLKLRKVASGEADLYPRLRRTMAWDAAAGDAVLRAAGGFVRCMEGRAFTHHRSRVDGEDPFANPGLWRPAPSNPPIWSR